MINSPVFAQTPDPTTDPTDNAGDSSTFTDPESIDQTGSNATDPSSPDTGISNDVTGNDTTDQSLTPPDLTNPSDENGVNLTAPDSNFTSSQTVPEFGPEAGIAIIVALIGSVALSRRFII